MRRIRIVCTLSIVLLNGWMTGQAAGQDAMRTVPAGAVVASSGAAVTVDEKNGNVVSIRLRDAEEMARPHPAGGETPFGYLEVIDLHDHRTYNTLVARSVLTDWKVTGSGDTTGITFVQDYDGAPFRIVQTFRASPVGVRWEATLRLLDRQKATTSTMKSSPIRSWNCGAGRTPMAR